MEMIPINKILDVSFKSRDLKRKVTIREYFVLLFTKLWNEEDNFDSKRPFGNSSWKHDLVMCLIKEKFISGLIEDDCAEEYNEQEFEDFVKKEIFSRLFK